MAWRGNWSLGRREITWARQSMKWSMTSPAACGSTIAVAGCIAKGCHGPPAASGSFDKLRCLPIPCDY